MADFFQQFGGQAEPEEGGDFFAQFGGQAEEAQSPQVETPGTLRGLALSAASTGLAAEEIGAVLRTPVEVVRERGVEGLIDPGLLVEKYRETRDAFKQGVEQFGEENPVKSGIAKGVGIVGQVVSGGVNPISVAKSIGSGVRGLLTREGATAAVQAGRQLLTREGAKAAAVETGKTLAGGVGYGAAYGLSESEADLTKGEFLEAAQDTVEGGGVGGVLSVGGRALLSPIAAAQGARAAGFAERAGKAQAVAEFDAAVAAYPDELAAIKAANAAEKQAAALDNAAAKEAAATQNAAAIEAASAQNAAAREAATAENAARRLQYRTETAAAKAEAKAATQANQSAAQEAELAAARANPLRRTGLETKLQAQYGPKVAKARAQALVDEPMPGVEGKTLIDEAEKLTPEARYDYAEALRMGQGKLLGDIRTELAKVPGATVPAAPIKAELKEALGPLPPEVQAKGLKQIEAMIGKVAKDGSLSPAALRKLIEDTNALAKYGSPRLEAALGRAQKRIFRSAYTALVNRERELIGKVLPEARAAEYTEALRKYAVYSDFEQSADVLLRRANKGLPAIKVKKAGEVEPVAPRAVAAPEKVKAAKVKPQLQEPTLREPLLKPEPAAPEFVGGEEALAAGRKLLEPSAGARAVGLGLRLAATEGGARAGALFPLPGSIGFGANRGSVVGRTLEDVWLNWVTATPGSLSAKAAKLERLKPMMEEALRKGPAEVALLHARFMQRSPDYRKAIESE